MRLMSYGGHDSTRIRTPGLEMVVARLGTVYLCAPTLCATSVESMATLAFDVFGYRRR